MPQNIPTPLNVFRCFQVILGRQMQTGLRRVVQMPWQQPCPWPQSALVSGNPIWRNLPEDEQWWQL